MGWTVVFMSEVFYQYSHAESIIVEDEAQSMKCEGPITNAHKEEEQGHAVESSDDQELDSGEQRAPSYNCG